MDVKTVDRELFESYKIEVEGLCNEVRGLLHTKQDRIKPGVWIPATLAFFLQFIVMSSAVVYSYGVMNSKLEHTLSLLKESTKDRYHAQRAYADFSLRDARLEHNSRDIERNTNLVSQIASELRSHEDLGYHAVAEEQLQQLQREVFSLHSAWDIGRMHGTGGMGGMGYQETGTEKH